MISVVKRSNFLAVAAAAGLLAWFVDASRVPAQTETVVPDWETAAGGKIQFDVTSVKRNISGDSNFSFNVPQTGGLMSATNRPVYEYIVFAYKLAPPLDQRLIDQLPKWALIEDFDIEGRTAITNPTRDQFRLMMQSLLADRFKLAAHFETHEAPVYARWSWIGPASWGHSFVRTSKILRVLIRRLRVRSRHFQAAPRSFAESWWRCAQRRQDELPARADEIYSSRKWPIGSACQL